MAKNTIKNITTKLPSHFFSLEICQIVHLFLQIYKWKIKVNCMCNVLRHQMYYLSSYHSLKNCGVTEAGCVFLSSALSLNPSHLKVLDLSWNNIGDSGVKHLCAALEKFQCALETLKWVTTNVIVMFVVRFR